MAKPIRRLEGAYEAEHYYTTTPRTASEVTVRLDAHELLDYARARLDVAAMLGADFTQQPATGVIGFLTGSIGLLATAREILEPLHPRRFKFAAGLSHSNREHDNEADLRAVLDELYRQGVRRFVLVDEVKSGTQMKTGIKAALKWARQGGRSDVEISAVGVSAAAPQGLERPPTVAELVSEIGATGRITNPRTISTRELLEMDRPGLKFRGVKRRPEYLGEYGFEREQPSGGLLIVCPDGGETGGAGVTSLDTAFGGTIGRIIGLSTPEASAEWFDVGDEPVAGAPPLLQTWPDTIERGSCVECRRLLAAARIAAAARQEWTSVAAYYKSERDEHRPGRQLDHWLSGEKQVAGAGKRLGVPPWLLR